MAKVVRSRIFPSPRNTVFWYRVIALILMGSAILGIYFYSNYDTNLMLAPGDTIRLQCGQSQLLTKHGFGTSGVINPNGLYVMARNNESAFRACQSLVLGWGPYLINSPFQDLIKSVEESAKGDCESKLNGVTVECGKMTCGGVEIQCDPGVILPAQCSILKTNVKIVRVWNNFGEETTKFYCDIQIDSEAFGSKRVGCSSCAQQ